MTSRDTGCSFPLPVRLHDVARSHQTMTAEMKRPVESLRAVSLCTAEHEVPRIIKELLVIVARKGNESTFVSIITLPLYRDNKTLSKT